MRLVGIANKDTTVLRYQMRDLLWGFEQLGHETEIMFFDPAQPQEEVTAFIAKSDVLVGITAGRWRFPPGMIAADKPVWLYDQDNECGMIQTEQFTEHDHIWTLLPSWAEELNNRGIKAHHMPPGVNKDIFFADDTPRNDKVIFIGNHYPGRDTQILDSLPPGVSADIRGAYEYFRSSLSFDVRVDEALTAYYQEKRPDWNLEATQNYIRPEHRKHLELAMHYWHRQFWVTELVKQLGDRIELYGHGWEQWPDNNKGPVENGEESAKLLRQAGCVIYLHPFTVCHPRLFEAAACGAPVVVGTPDDLLTTYFHTSAIYETLTIDDMAKTIEGVLNGELDAAVTGKNAAEAAQDWHGFDKRAAQMIKDAEEDIKERADDG